MRNAISLFPITSCRNGISKGLLSFLPRTKSCTVKIWSFPMPVRSFNISQCMLYALILWPLRRIIAFPCIVTCSKVKHKRKNMPRVKGKRSVSFAVCMWQFKCVFMLFLLARITSWVSCFSTDLKNKFMIVCCLLYDFTNIKHVIRVMLDIYISFNSSLRKW